MNDVKLVVFSGIDGSGKTTQAEFFYTKLCEQGCQVDYVWARRVPVLTRLPAHIIKKFLLREKGKSDGQDYIEITQRRKGVFENKWLRFCWTRLLLTEYLFLTWYRFFVNHRQAEYLVVDRYLADALVDFASMAPNPTDELSRLQRTFLAKLFPKPVISYLVDIPAEVGWDRKQDGTSLEYLIDRRPLYVDFALTAQNSFVIDGTKPTHVVAEDVWKLFDVKKLQGFR